MTPHRQLIFLPQHKKGWHVSTAVSPNKDLATKEVHSSLGTTVGLTSRCAEILSCQCDAVKTVSCCVLSYGPSISATWVCQSQSEMFCTLMTGRYAEEWSAVINQFQSLTTKIPNINPCEPICSESSMNHIKPLRTMNISYQLSWSSLSP